MLIICYRWKIYFHFQEYPTGVILIPMGSRTAKPFHTTNLVVFAPENVPNASKDNQLIVYGDALIVDPGCLSKFHGEVILLHNMQNCAVNTCHFSLQIMFLSFCFLFHAHEMHISYFVQDHTAMTT